MWLDPGIDTGDIVASELTPVSFQETLGALHVKVMDHAHDMYVRSAHRVVSGGSLPRVSQSLLGEGRTYLTRDWNLATIRRAVRNFKELYGPGVLHNTAHGRARDSVRTLALER